MKQMKDRILAFLAGCWNRLLIEWKFQRLSSRARVLLDASKCKYCGEITNADLYQQFIDVVEEMDNMARETTSLTF